MIYGKLMDLAEQLESMISDGVQLTQGGNLFNWSDTAIVEIIEEINKQKDFLSSQTVKTGDILTNIITKEQMTVIDTDEKNISIEPLKTPIKYAKKELWKHYKI